MSLATLRLPKAREEKVEEKPPREQWEAWKKLWRRHQEWYFGRIFGPTKSWVIMLFLAKDWICCMICSLLTSPANMILQRQSMRSNSSQGLRGGWWNLSSIGFSDFPDRHDMFFFLNAPSQIVKLMIHELWWSDIMCNNDNHWLLQDIYCIDMWYVYNINGIWNLMMYLRSPRREWQYYIMSMQGSLKTVWELSGLLPKQLMSFLVLHIFSTINICHYNWYKYH